MGQASFKEKKILPKFEKEIERNANQKYLKQVLNGLKKEVDEDGNVLSKFVQVKKRLKGIQKKKYQECRPKNMLDGQTDLNILLKQKKN